MKRYLLTLAVLLPLAAPAAPYWNDVRAAYVTLPC